MIPELTAHVIRYGRPVVIQGKYVEKEGLVGHICITCSGSGMLSGSTFSCPIVCKECNGYGKQFSAHEEKAVLTALANELDDMTQNEIDNLIFT